MGYDSQRARRAAARHRFGHGWQLPVRTCSRQGSYDLTEHRRVDGGTGCCAQPAANVQSSRE
jgi:hypothetical protein